jgi:hypothetical protein
MDLLKLRGEQRPLRSGGRLSRRLLPGRRLSVALAVTALAAVGAASAFGELTQKGNLFVRFDGGISPNALPRKSLAPIAVRIEGTIRTPAGQKPPGLRRIRIALNREGRLSTRGLPVCGRSRIAAATPSEALARCGPALVGSGGIVARTSFKDQPSTYLLRGSLLLFNAVVHGRPAILGHLYQGYPAPITNIIVFDIRHTGGTFGTVISGTLPLSVNRNGYLKSIFLQLQRSYTYRGRPRAYLSASCPAPPGFPGALFPFAHASMSFDDGRALSSTLVRSCKVKR